MSITCLWFFFAIWGRMYTNICLCGFLRYFLFLCISAFAFQALLLVSFLWSFSKAASALPVNCFAFTISSAKSSHFQAFRHMSLYSSASSWLFFSIIDCYLIISSLALITFTNRLKQELQTPGIYSEPGRLFTVRNIFHGSILNTSFAFLSILSWLSFP